jgi:hypothetical protein
LQLGVRAYGELKIVALFSKEDIKNESISIFPNPANSQTTLSFSIEKSCNVSLEIFDLLGKRLKSVILGELSVGSHSLDIDLSELQSGTYYYRITEGNIVETQKIVIDR